jgi:hypothetical protein
MFEEIRATTTLSTMQMLFKHWQIVVLILIDSHLLADRLIALYFYCHFAFPSEQ